MKFKRIIPLLAGLFLFALLWTQGPAQAATTLVAGDIAIIGYNFDDPDELAFVALENIDAGVVISFTDNGWISSSNSFRTGEGTFMWTAPATICAGEVVSPAVSGVAFSGSGDQILAYQGNTSSPTFIYALNSDGSTWAANATSSNNSALPTGLTDGTTAIAIQEIDNSIYTGITSGTRAVLLAAISDPANWSGNNTTRQTMPSSSFNVTDATSCGVDDPPTVSSTNPSDGATGVAIDATVTVTFSEDVTFNNTADYVCNGISSSFSVTPTGGPTTWTITPSSPLANDESCTVTITNLDVSDMDGTFDQMVADYQFSFTTAGAASPASELLLSEIVVTPTTGEFIEIYNPGASIIDLSNVYLTDATYSGGSDYYYNIVTGSDLGGGGFGDFHARFPSGATIAAGTYQTVALNGSDNFFAEYGINPTYELYEDGVADGIPDMREAAPGSINNQGGLSDSGEVVILYYWDNNSDLVTDLDYVVWGDKGEAVDKSSLSIDGPDADSTTSSYLNDTAIGSQDVTDNVGHASGNAWQRDDLNEGSETTTGGNGVDGHNETSENLSATWCESATITPNTASDCPDPIVINEILADPDATNGDANGDGVVDTADDEFVEIVNTSGADLDISGWTLADGFGVRHTFPANTIIPADCAIVVFGGGTPTGSFGNALVQIAGSLGLNNGGDTITINDGSKNYSVTYGGDGGDNQSLTLDPDISGGSFVKHSVATGSGSALFSPGTQIDGSSFSGCSGSNVPCDGNATLIHTIQGSGTTSPYIGQTHTIEGIVVGDFQGTDQLSGFYVQEEDADADADSSTSEGIFVDSTIPVDIGDQVSVTGIVDENFALTQLGPVSNVSICGTGVIVPNAVSPTFPVSAVSDLEAFEGMLTIIPQTLTVTENYNLGRYGEVLLSSGGHLMNPTQVADPGVAATAVHDANLLNQILLDDGSSVQNLDPIVYPAPELSAANTLRTGDTVTNLTGIMSYGYGVYRIHPTSTPAFTAANLRTSAPSAVGGSLKIASFNVLNYFNGDGVGGGFPTSRGADSLAEFNRQRDKIIAAISALDADVVGLMEIENDGYDSNNAIQDLVNGLNPPIGSPIWAFVDPGTPTIGTDAITVGLIYKIAKVTPSGAAVTLSSDAFADRNRQPLVQTFVDGSGEKFTVAVNHFKSKGSDCNDGEADDPDEVFPDDPDTGDWQGNCNITRTMAAAQLAAWLATDPTTSNDPDFIIMGDLNAYAREDPIKALKDAGYTNLFASFVQNSYSYVYGGEFGTLDYIMANESLTAQVTGATSWHINANEPFSLDYNLEYKSVDQQTDLYAPDAYRASDHDPVIIGLEMNSTTEADFSDLDSVYDTAWHTGNGAIRLGSMWTADTTFAANNDNASDDGVTVGPGTGLQGQWQPGENGASLNIEVVGGAGCVYAWVDWNNDGFFDDSDDPGNLEYAIRSVTASAGIANYQFDVPANQFLPPGTSNTDPNQSYNVRVRLYGSCSSGPTGAAFNGEVEDYTFTFTPTAVTLQSFSANQHTTTLWLAVLLVIVTLLAGSLLIWRNGRSHYRN